MSHVKGNLPTGGPLNFLNEAAQTNSRKNTVPIMLLVSTHKPKTPEELKELISNHVNNDCSCGLKSAGTVEDFAKNLYNAQFVNWTYKNKYPDEKEYTLDERYSFMYSLFCIGPLRGLSSENDSKKLVKSILNKENILYKIEDATEEEDFNYAVDYKIFLYKNKISEIPDKAIGIQVKPQSFFKNKQALNVNNDKHKIYKYPVKYHVYNNHNMRFIYDSTSEVIQSIKAIVKE